ncbi:hypothetical protein GALMADRAFT_133925 [Galerina marginata CBS 339.88]|uniref:DUF4360 domain-containing protein n=1 Tax=Galerina marginata (strain CBS 339.88) TaxID=685588 RepID=A0A067U029_GALM3|nr:hypothetical protein GALMADRAFT_133925 [Galerina marginata CBS 339.88]
MFKFLVLGATLLTYALSALAIPQRNGGGDPVNIPVTVPAPPGFNITSLGVNGSGCPPGTAYYLLNVDRTAVTVTFSQYYAEGGPGIAISQNRKNCQLTFGVSVPPGFTYGIATVDYRGYYQLDSQVTASQQSIYYFQGVLTQATARSDLVGPVDGKDYTYRDTFDLVSTVLAPCGVSSVLNIQSDLRVSNAKNTKGSGYIATDSVDTQLTTTFNFQWQTCK